MPMNSPESSSCLTISKVRYFPFTVNGLMCHYVSPENAKGDNSPHSMFAIGKQSYMCRPIAIHHFIHSEVHALLRYVYLLTCLSAWLIRSEARAKFFNFCGLPCARLDADKSIYPEDTDFHPLISSLNFALEAMLFWAPRARLNDLQKVWVDESVITPRWKNFNRNLMTEWTGITIYVCIIESASHFVT